MTAKQPFLPLFFGDFLASTAEWTGEEQALYLLLLGHQWSLGSIPADVEKVRRLARWERRTFGAAWSTVGDKFPELDGRRQNERLEQHRERSNEISKLRSLASAKGVEARRSKRQPNDNQTVEQTANKQDSDDRGLINNPSHPIPEEEKNPPTPLRGGAGLHTQTGRKPRDIRAASNTAWGRVVEGSGRSYLRAEFEQADLTLADAVDRLGGWNRFGQSTAIGTLKAPFRELYEQLIQHESHDSNQAATA